MDRNINDVKQDLMYQMYNLDKKINNSNEKIDKNKKDLVDK